MDIILGQVVYSKAGRDAGDKFIVVGIADKLHVLISDGDLRKIEKPKKKKIKHLSLSEVIIDSLNKKLINGIKIANSEIKKAILGCENNIDSGGS